MSNSGWVPPYPKTAMSRFAPDPSYWTAISAPALFLAKCLSPRRSGVILPTTVLVHLCKIATTPAPSSSWFDLSHPTLQAGGVSVLFRQTNAVWVAFTLAVCLLEDFTPRVCVPAAAEAAARRSDGTGAPASPRRLTWGTTRKRKNNPGTVDSGLSEAEVLTRGRSLEESKSGGNNDDDGDDGDDDGVASAAQTGHDSLPPLRLLLLLARAALVDSRRGAPQLRGRAPLAAPIVLFAVFVWGFNGGVIVLGDKENHSPGGPPHLAQLAYLVAVAAALWGVVGGRQAAFGPEARTGFARWARKRGAVGVAVIVAGVAVGLWR